MQSLKQALLRDQFPELQQRNELQIEVFYYKSKGRGKTPIEVNSPLKFIAAACEYPEPKPVELGFYVDQHNPDLVLPGADYAVHGPSSSMIRHSPRLAGASPVYEFDILLYCGVEKNTAAGKLVRIRQVNPEDNLKKIKQRVREKVQAACIRAGFYWVLKGKKAVLQSGGRQRL